LLFGGFIGHGLKLEPYCPSKASKGDLVSRPSNSRGNNPMILPFQSALSKGSSGNKKKFDIVVAWHVWHFFLSNNFFLKLGKLQKNKNI
jgi:hypothetical protein